MIPTGEKAVPAVPTAQALQEGAAFANKKVEDYAEASQFVTHVIKVGARASVLCRDRP